MVARAEMTPVDGKGGHVLSFHSRTVRVQCRRGRRGFILEIVISPANGYSDNGSVKEGTLSVK